jgi:hypothetical protein
MHCLRAQAVFAHRMCKNGFFEHSGASMKNLAHSFKTVACATLLFSASVGAGAADLTQFGALTQAQFVALGKDLAAATSYKAIEPAAPLGLTGFDVSVSASSTKTQAGSAWSAVTGDSMDNLVATKVSVSKGLPWGVDVGAFLATVPSSNVKATGLNVKYALMEGGIATPAVALRGSYSRMSGVSQMDLNNMGVDLLVSKGFLGLTPYGGAGLVRSSLTSNVSNLSSENFSQTKAFAGISWTMVLFNLSAEYDRTGKASSFTVKTGLRF